VRTKSVINIQIAGFKLPIHPKHLLLLWVVIVQPTVRY